MGCCWESPGQPWREMREVPRNGRVGTERSLGYRGNILHRRKWTWSGVSGEGTGLITLSDS